MRENIHLDDVLDLEVHDEEDPNEFDNINGNQVRRELVRTYFTR